MTFWSDVRHGARLLVKDWGFTLAAVATLAIGIAVNMLVFTLINGALLRDLPFSEPDRIVEIRVFHRDRPQEPTSGASYLDVRDWRDAVQAFDGIGAADEQTMNVSDEAHAAERFEGAFVSWDAFALIGVRPVLGRDFRADDDRVGATPVVLLGHDVWRSRYDSDASIVGRTIRVNGVSSVVVGVMPDNFGFPATAELWQPLALLSAEERDDRRYRAFDAFGRLRAGMSLEQATADLGRVMNGLAAQHPETNKETEPRLAPFRIGVGGPIRILFGTLLGAVVFVLLIACANVANLLLARVAGRVREVSVRLSMGASRWRIVRQLLVENLLLAALGGACGLALSVGGIRLFWSVAQDTHPPYWLRFPFDLRVFGYLAAVCLGTTILFGLLPALQTARTNLVEVLNDATRGSTGGRRGRRWSGALIVGQIALTLILLSGALAVVQNAVALTSQEAGVDTARLLRLRIDLPATSYATPEQRVSFYRRLEDRVAGGATRVALANVPPLAGGRRRAVELTGQPAGVERPAATQVTIGDRYFDTIGARPLRGRQFVRGDGEPGRGTAIVNERFAAMFFRGEDAIGQRIRLADPVRPGQAPASPGEWLTVVGVSQNVRQRPGPDMGFDPVVYVPFTSDVVWNMNVLLRTDGDMATAAAALRAQVAAIDRDLPLFDVRTVDDLLTFQNWGQRVFGTMFGVFASLALLMAAVGLYAVTAYGVSQRTREFGVRMALGAPALHVAWLVARRSSWQVAAGLLLGALGAVAVSRVTPAVVSASRAGDPAFLAGVVAFVIVVAAFACLVPARRAVRVDPVVALRND
ncbi:MAG TPA: ABC transporter permease [Vicinamibacterales bacterium]|nr:ABC transporter permease [Vicinamibacterales bacterium]